MVPEVVIEKRHSIKEANEGEIPWHWPRIAFPLAEARDAGRSGFYTEARRFFSYVRRNETSGEKFTVSMDIQEGRLMADGVMGGEEVLSATFKQGTEGLRDVDPEDEGEGDEPEFEVLHVFGNARNRH